MATYAYIRVSTKEQNEDRQYIAMQKLNIPDKNIYLDRQSGKDFNRKNYKRVVKRLKENDLFVVKSIDRLGRNYKEIIEQWQYIVKVKKADIMVIDIPILDTRQAKDLIGTLISDLVLQLLSYVAENERINIRSRQAEGIAAAKARGVKFGRPQVDLPENFHEVHRQWRNGEFAIKEAAAKCCMPPSTFYDKARQLEDIL